MYILCYFFRGKYFVFYGENFMILANPGFTSIHEKKQLYVFH